MEINNYDYISDLYDIYVPATFDIEFLIKETKKSPGEVLELMSGTGRVSVPLLQAGVKLTCVDLSAKLNAVFKRKLEQMKLKADIYRMDIRQLEIPKKFGMIIIPFHSFAHIVSADDQRKTLRRIQRHLLPGGIFICTLGNPARRQKWIDGQLRLFRKYPLTGERPIHPSIDSRRNAAVHHRLCGHHPILPGSIYRIPYARLAVGTDPVAMFALFGLFYLLALVSNGVYILMDVVSDGLLDWARVNLPWPVERNRVI